MGEGRESVRFSRELARIPLALCLLGASWLACATSRQAETSDSAGATFDQRLGESGQLLEEMAGACRGTAMRTFQLEWRYSVMFEAVCFFGEEEDTLVPAARPDVKLIADALKKRKGRQYLVLGHPKAGASSAPFRTLRALAAAQAAALVEAMEAAGVEKSRLIAGGSGDRSHWPANYDGPSGLTPGENALIEIVLLPTREELAPSK